MGLRTYSARILRRALSFAPVHDTPTLRLAAAINSLTAKPSAEFFRGVDRARRDFLDQEPTLEQKLSALKLINLLIAKHEYQRGAIAVTARPVGFMLDPANQCHLGCPSCTNSYNREYAEATFKPWPRGLMTAETFDRFAGDVALYAFNGHFYNNHEPLLNKRTPEFVRKAADLRVQTFISSNLSFRKIDAEAIVASGLRELMVAADGVTQSVYEGYRRGGHIDWVMDNARAIVEAKRRLSSDTPILRWQYLTFAHNVHEIERAVTTARDIGFNTFNLAKPNAVDEDDPSISPAEPPSKRDYVFIPPPALHFAGDLEPHREMIDEAIAERSFPRWEAHDADDCSDSPDRCDWLHLATISDATGRLVPCCIGDYKKLGRFHFATLGDEIMNSATYREARRAISDHSTKPDIACSRCTHRPLPQVGLGAVYHYLMSDPALADCGWLYNWSRHNAQPAEALN
jgi:hypothetical protein